MKVQAIENVRYEGKIYVAGEDFDHKDPKKAIELGLSMDQDLALAKLQLAGIAMTRRRKIEANKLLTEAKKLDKHGMLKDQIKMMKDQMKKM